MFSVWCGNNVAEPAIELYQWPSFVSNGASSTLTSFMIVSSRTSGCTSSSAMVLATFLLSVHAIPRKKQSVPRWMLLNRLR